MFIKEFQLENWHQIPFVDLNHMSSKYQSKEKNHLVYRNFNLYEYLIVLFCFLFDILL